MNRCLLSLYFSIVCNLIALLFVRKQGNVPFIIFDFGLHAFQFDNVICLFCVQSSIRSLCLHSDTITIEGCCFTSICMKNVRARAMKHCFRCEENCIICKLHRFCVFFYTASFYTYHMNDAEKKNSFRSKNMIAW